MRQWSVLLEGTNAYSDFGKVYIPRDIKYVIALQWWQLYAVYYLIYNK